MKAVGLALLLTVGCTSLIPAGRTVTDDCRRYDALYMGTHAASVAVSSLAGGTAAGTVLSASLADEPWADVGLAVGGTVLGAVAVLLQVLSADYAERAAEACRTPEPAPSTAEP